MAAMPGDSWCGVLDGAASFVVVILDSSATLEKEDCLECVVVVERLLLFLFFSAGLEAFYYSLCEKARQRGKRRGRLATTTREIQRLL